MTARRGLFSVTDGNTPGISTVESAGAQGPAGQGLSFQGPFNFGNQYHKGDVVSYLGVGANGSTYVAVVDNINEGVVANPTKWQQLTESFAMQGAYNGATTYYVDQLVTFGGHTYRCTANGTVGGATPDTNANFQLLC